MFPVRDSGRSRQLPLVTYTLIALNVLIFLWDRNFNLFGSRVVFSDLTMVPSAITGALTGDGNPNVLVTIFTSMFLHANLVHLIGNLLFLMTFGENVEAGMGSPRFALMYLFWGIVAAAAHILVMPDSLISTLGASGAIGGVLGSYFLLFPGNRISIMVPPFIFWTFEVAAWILLGMWFLWQILFPQEGVANWAHAGGFLAGMLTVLIAGGRLRLLKDKEFEFDDD
jgi:membrane associated rhomboid family serine protease